MLYFAQWYLDGMQEGYEDTHCHCGNDLFYSDDPTYAQFHDSFCKECIDVRCDAFPGACE